MKNSLLASEPVNADNCINLRPDSHDPGHRLVPALPPAIIASRPWAVCGIFINSRDEVIEIMHHDGAIAALHRSQAGDPGEPYVVVESVNGEIKSACRCNDGYMVYTSTTIYHLVPDESGMLRSLPPVSVNHYPVPVMLVTGSASYPCHTAPVKLSGIYDSRSTTLSVPDSRKVGLVLAETYREARLSAALAGSFIAPVLGRYRLYDRYGNMVFESCPKLLYPSARHDLSMSPSLLFDPSYTSLESTQINIPCFDVEVKFPAVNTSSYTGEIERMEVQLTPMIHTLDTVLPCLNRVSVSTHGDLQVTATLPGYGDNDPDHMVARESVRRCVECADSLFRTVSVIKDPFRASLSNTMVKVTPPVATVKSEMDSISKATAPSGQSSWLTCCHSPHMVTAATSYRDGDMTLLGNLTVTLFDGHRASYYVNGGSVIDDVTTRAWVTFNDGRRVAIDGNDRLWRDMQLSALVCYPHPDAVLIELSLTDSAGTCRYASLPLSRCGRYAMWLGRELSGWQPEVVDTPPARRECAPSRISLPGCLISFKGDRPGDGLSGTETGGEIMVIHPVARPSTTSWETSRSRYHVMGSDGIFSLSNSSSTLTPPVKLDSRPVTSTRSVVTISQPGQAPRVCAIAGGDLVMIDGNSVKTMARNIDATMLAWNPRHAELLAIEPSNDSSDMSRALVYHTTCNGWSVRTLPPATDIFCHQSFGRLTSSHDGYLYDLNRDIEAPTHCSITRQLPLKVKHPFTGVPSVSEVCADLTASWAEGMLVVAGDNGRGPASPLSRLWFNGEINRPLVHRTLMPRRSRLFVTVDALLSADAVLGSGLVV